MAGGDWKDMFAAVQKNDKELVAYHLRMGIDPNYQHPEFMTTFLLESVKQEHFEIAQLLLENGANPIVKEIWGDHTPLSLAQLKGNQELVSLIEGYL